MKRMLSWAAFPAVLREEADSLEVVLEAADPLVRAVEVQVVPDVVQADLAVAVLAVAADHLRAVRAALSQAGQTLFQRLRRLSL